jgi:succinylarginine dihydrolase
MPTWGFPSKLPIE